MAGKAEEIFQRVYNAVNKRLGAQGGGTLERSAIKEILAEEGLDSKEWYPALSRAKKQTPNLYELFYKAFGREPPASAPPHENQPEEEAPAEEEGPVSMLDCFTTVAHWCGRVTPEERRRVLAAVAVLYPDERA